MGMYDSLFVKCPVCGRSLQYQSKTGPKMLGSYNKKNLPIDVASGMNGDIVKCDGCGKNIKLKITIPKIKNIKLIVTNKKYNYHGNRSSPLYFFGDHVTVLETLKQGIVISSTKIKNNKKNYHLDYIYTVSFEDGEFIDYKYDEITTGWENGEE